MKKIITLIIGLFLFNAGYGEQEPTAYALNEEYNFWNLQKGQTACVFADNAYIRSYPDLKSKILDSIVLGTPVTIVSPAYNGDKVRGFYAPWYEVVYKKDNEDRKGFIWLGLLALGRNVDADGNQYIHGFERFVSYTNLVQAHYDCAVKLLDINGNFISKYEFTYNFGDQTFTQSKILPSMGLEGIKNIHRIEFVGEACGVPTNYYYVAWNGEKFIEMPGRYRVSDAGVFYYNESILFPSEHKKEPNYIYKLIEQGEVMDEKADDYKYLVNKRQEIYYWNGTSFVFLPALKGTRFK
ncbi:SH3 domain-containing protein [Pseudopedobacter beijingensis]|uniref:SH3 domain-containing protein n=1 Tax=Pseudopedobacter beijingensis TaxID=1207056 RepID=A0ABW4IGW7_9SPHI